MKKYKKILIPAAILLSSVLLATLIILARPKVETAPAEIVRKPIRVQTVKKKSLPMTVKSQGRITPRTESRLVSQVAGRVLKVSPAFAAGGFFEKGDILITLDDSDYQLAVTRAGAQVAQAEVNLQVQEEEAQIAREEWQRLNDGPIPPLVAREPQLNQARATLNAARADLKQAELQLQRTRIRAPYVGRVRAKNVDVGQYITPGSLLATIYAVDFLEVRLPINDEALALIDMPFSFRGQAQNQKGPAVKLSADFAGKLQTWEGYLTRIEGEIDPQSRMINVVARVEDPYKAGKGAVPLTVGLFVDAEIQGKTIDGIVELPRSTLRNGNQILIVDDNQQLRHRQVEILRSAAESVFISSGLSNGEQICISPLGTVVDGMAVTIVDQAEGLVSKGGQQ